MKSRVLVAYALIGLGGITLLARLSDGASWLWIGLVAAAMFFAYSRQRTYGLLVLGGFLAGTAAGILFQEIFRFDGVFLIGLGAGIAAIDAVERRPNRWPRTFGAALAAIGVLIGVAQTGAFESVWFALLLIAIGVALIARNADERAGSRGASAAGSAAGSASGSPGPSATPAGAGDVPAPRPQGGAEGGHAATAVTARRARLESWRARVAATEDKSPRAILTDDVLDALAEDPPADLTALAAVRGIGPVKLERYGAEIIEVLRRGRA